jgi:hypothetical protein
MQTQTFRKVSQQIYEDWGRALAIKDQSGPRYQEN